MKRWTNLLLVLVLVFTNLFGLSGSASTWNGMLGDVTDNDRVDAADALKDLQHAVQLIALSEDEFQRGEVNGDHEVNATDALLILQFSVSLISRFPRSTETENPDDSNPSDEPDSPNDPDTPTEPTIPTAAYAPDTTADNSFSVSLEGLAPKTVYTIRNGCFGGNDNIKSDGFRLACSLQGLLNRDFNGIDKTSMMFLYSPNEEKTWFNYMQGEGKFLEGYETIDLQSWHDFIAAFREQIFDCGIVLWDPAVPSTANVAATICGIDGYLPVKYDTQENSVYNKLMEEFDENLVRCSLVGAFTSPQKGAQKTFLNFTYTSSGSSKCDAYLWALEAYMDRCSANYIAYTVDGEPNVDGTPISGTSFTSSCLVNHDYYIARRCFFFDLTSNNKEAPCDDPNQPLGTDLATLKTILQARYDRAGGKFGQIFGFPPWWLKYTTHLNRNNVDPVALEWDFTEWCTAYNLAKEADASSPCYMYNASVYYKYVPTVTKYENNRPTQKLTFDPNTYYFTLYLGDYDSSAWMKKWVTEYWMKDNARGEIPMAWAYNPNLSDRAPMLFDYVYENATKNDYFITGDSGAGYIVPEMLFEGNAKRTNPDGSRAWAEYAKPYHEKFDMDICGFILNTSHSVKNNILDVYNQISPAGSFHIDRNRPLTVYKGVPYICIATYVSAKDGERAASMQQMYTDMLSIMGLKAGANFAVYRDICSSPDEIKALVEEYTAYCAERSIKVQYVDPYTLFDLIRQSGQGEIIQ